METFDAVVVGSGPNGLVAANHLVDAGWSVLVLEAQPSWGGAVRSDSDVHPDFVHDTFSAFYPLAAASPTVQALGLEEHGLVWRRAPAVLGHVSATAGGLAAPRPVPDRGRLARPCRPGGLAARCATCGTGSAPTWSAALLSPFPPVRHGTPWRSASPAPAVSSWCARLLSPAADLGESWFRDREARALLLGNAGHADIPMQAPGSGLFGVVMTMLAQSVGFPVPEGGAQRLSDALVTRLRARGGEVRCGQEVVRSWSTAAGRAPY